MTNAKLLEQIRKDYDYALAYWQPMRDERQKNVRYVTGDPWDPTEKAQRQTPGQQRPCLVFDELNQYVNQLVNSIRMDKRAIKLLPRGSGANDKEAELRGNITRGIEYSSNAQGSYVRAFEDAVIGGYGFARVVKEYVSEDSFDMELKIEPVPNPDSILVDPEAKKPSLCDARYFFEEMTMRKETFEREFPDAKPISSQTIGPGTVLMPGDGDSNVTVLSYWYVETTKDQTLYLRFPDGTEVKGMLSDLKEEGYSLSGDALVSKQPDGTEVMVAEVLRKRKSEKRRVRNCITNMQEILEESEWEGKYLPLAACLAKEVYVREGSSVRRKLMPLVSLARDPYMLYCYYRSTEAEIVGQTPKVPYIGYEGQFEGHEEQWQKVNRVPLPYLQAKAMTDATGQQILPLPQKSTYEPPIQALEMGAESSRRAIQAAMGISALPTAAQRNNEKSGVALERIATQQAQGSFHFVDNYETHFLSHLGVIIDDLLPKVYDTPRDVPAYDSADEFEVVHINEAVPNQQTGEVEENLLTDSSFIVTVGSGPSYESQREEADEFLNGLAGTPMAPLVMDLIVKMKRLGPIGDEIAERLTPPEVKAQREMGDIPPQLVAQLQEMQQTIESLNAYAETIEAQNATLKSDLLQTLVKNKGEIQKELVRGKIELIKEAVKQDSETRRVVRGAVIQAELSQMDKEIAAQQQQQDAIVSEQTAEAQPNDNPQGNV